MNDERRRLNDRLKDVMPLQLACASNISLYVVLQLGTGLSMQAIDLQYTRESKYGVGHALAVHDGCCMSIAVVVIKNLNTDASHVYSLPPIAFYLH